MYLSKLTLLMIIFLASCGGGDDRVDLITHFQPSDQLL